MIQLNEEWLNKSNGKYICPYCEKEYTKKGICTHIWRSHGEGKNFTGNNDGYRDGTREVWNKGLDKTDIRVQKMIKSLKITLDEKIKKGYKPGPRNGFSKETLKTLSEKQTKNLIKQYSEGRVVTGGKVKWIHYKDIKVQGSYELRMCHILDKMKELEEIESWEYTNDRVDYININNKKSKYLLDFKVFNRDGTFYYIETKGRIVENDYLKWQSVRDNGFVLEIYDLKRIKEKEASIAQG